MERLKKLDRSKQHRQRLEHAASTRDLQAKPAPPPPPPLPIPCEPPEPISPPYEYRCWWPEPERHESELAQQAWRSVRIGSVWSETVWAARARAHVRRRLRILTAWGCNSDHPRKGRRASVGTEGTSLRHEVAVEISGLTGKELCRYGNAWRGLEYVDECCAEGMMAMTLLDYTNTAGKVFSISMEPAQNDHDNVGESAEQPRFGQQAFSRAALQRKIEILRLDRPFVNQIQFARQSWRVEWLSEHSPFDWLETFPPPRPEEDFGGSSKEELEANARSAQLQRTRCVMLTHALDEIGGEAGLQKLLKIMRKRIRRSDGLGVKLMVAQRYASAEDFTGISMSPEQITRFVVNRGWRKEREEWVHAKVGSGTFHAVALNAWGEQVISERLKEEEAEVDGEHVWTAVFVLDIGGD